MEYDWLDWKGMRRPDPACQDDPNGALGTGLHPGRDYLLHHFGAIITEDTDKLVHGPLPRR